MYTVILLCYSMCLSVSRKILKIIAPYLFVNLWNKDMRCTYISPLHIAMVRNLHFEEPCPAILHMGCEYICWSDSHGL